MRLEMLKRIGAVMLSITLVATGVKLDFVLHTVSANQTDIILTEKETKITDKQKEEAKEEDEKLKKQIENTKKSKEENQKRTVVKELKNLRTSDSSTFLLSDGSRKLEIYGRNVYYKKDGKYVKYNPSLKEMSQSEQKELSKNERVMENNAIEEYAYVNTSGDAKHYFPQKLDEDSAVILTKDDYAISFAPKREEDNNNVSQDSVENINTVDDDNIVYSLCVEEKSVNDDNLTYRNNQNKVSYKYTSLTSGVKEEIILEEEPDTNVFEFELSLPGMKIQTFENTKELRVIEKKTGKLIAYIDEPNIKDAKGGLTYEDIYYETEKVKDGEYILKVVVDEDYLNDEDTAYPIVLDPTIILRKIHIIVKGREYLRRITV